MTKREITIWITYEEDEDVSPYDSARQVLGELNVPGLVKAETVSGLAFEWEAKVLDEVQA